MPPKRKAAAAAGNRTCSPAESLAAQRRKKMAAEPAEETTTIEVPGSRQDWLAPLYDMYCKRELDDIVLTVGDESLFAHKVVLAMASKMWRAEFGWSGTAESQSKEVKVEDVSFVALKSIVDFAYTGKLELSGSSVVAIIQAANLLQVVAVERAAVDFLVDGVDAGNVLSAMALGAHLSAGEIGRDLQDKSRAWVNRNFGLVAAEPSFLQLRAAELAGVLESDDLEGYRLEEDVFAAVVFWVKEDEAGRKGELARLLPLVRFPMMADEQMLILVNAEPLVAKHPLTLELLQETHQSFAQPGDAAACRRQRPRKGQVLGGSALLQKVPLLAFTRFSGTHATYTGGILRGTLHARDQAAVCAGHVMKSGLHAAEFTIVSDIVIDPGYPEDDRVIVGLARPWVDVNAEDAYSTDHFWGLDGSDGYVYHGDDDTGFWWSHWEGSERFGAGDVVGLLLDCDAGTLTVKKNGRRLGLAATGLPGELCWAVCLSRAGAGVRIASVETF
jgi:hypothetical protein